ncbi:MAG: KEOPS complex kinase/ATPase Bud32 [Candidatus Rehaiarchaeum fermentans]|nr:KEOPS complex kinase/ATPase Bud32 [Candidatus Rehaiarchaeum fermentans]MCW1293298.1 KEOPS complex kinase/ATPase Bud32 [Candidatus Rehaiarchaeum fermentans]MCW1293596.1 KEOPS complex kinase/ATPase Bud32 [Candidatus Rehaiarchaeum fermentans]MCW1297592.1 KEOPS complex kinase/ATPase Bud32 [Candidatus Rehaiarchaeum fermentans]MCW1302231.1 KEOPS complex kinase/ATPase Bud32 [Candidatus Rehaiarchaeum fermentans]
MIIAKGAEAVIRLENGIVIKERIRKNYRIEELDYKLRKSRTSIEAKVMKLCRENGILCPNVIDYNDFEIRMEYIDGKKLSDSFSLDLMKELGKTVAKMHNINIIHGDLTTSNVMIKDNKLYIIDFGLAKISKKIEDKATDIFTLKEALKANHTELWEKAFNIFISEYKNVSIEKDKILERYYDIEKRRRYYENSNY